jgi:hypothetical protein
MFNVGAWFYFTERDGFYQGRIVRMFNKPGVPADSDRCEKCEGNQKDAPMLGLTIVKAMKRDGRKHQDGKILDPRDGVRPGRQGRMKSYPELEGASSPSSPGSIVFSTHVIAVALVRRPTGSHRRRSSYPTRQYRHY